MVREAVIQNLLLIESSTRLPGKLLGANPDWEEEHLVMEDSWGQEWTYSQRRTLEFTCNSAYFLAIVQVNDTQVLPHFGQTFARRSSGRT